MSTAALLPQCQATVIQVLRCAVIIIVVVVITIAVAVIVKAAQAKAHAQQSPDTAKDAAPRGGS